VLVGFHGARGNGHRGNILWDHSAIATRNYHQWNYTAAVLNQYYAPWVLEPAETGLGPSTQFLIQAAECVYDKFHLEASSSTTTARIMQYDVMKLRLEWLEHSMTSHRGDVDGYDIKTLIGNCMNEAVDQLKMLLSTTTRKKSSRRPLFLLVDVGPFGSRTVHKGVLPTLDDILSHLQLRLNSDDDNSNIHTTDACNAGCLGPECYLLDQAIFLMAEHALMMPGIHQAAMQMVKSRRFASKNTTIVDPNYRDPGGLDKSTVNMCQVKVKVEV